MEKFLIVAHYSRFLVQFEMNNVKILQDLGYEVHYATNYEQEDMYVDAPKKIKDAGVILHQIDFVRSPYKFSANINAYRQLKKLMQDIDFSGVHCHTPMGGMLARMAAKATKTGPVIYTAHGFHFYKGAPLKNWLFYYSVEKLCSRFTDVLITINREDYALAQKKMRAKRVEYVPGVGLDLTKFGQTTIDKSAKRKELGIPENVTLLLSVGELNKNKNHETVIRAIKDLDAYYIIAGKGDLHEHLQNVIDELGLAKRVKLLGFRRDVAELYQTADVYVLPSIREGLNVSVMEAMASGLPVVCSRIRGNTDLIDENGGGIFNPRKIDDCKEAIEKLLISDTQQMGVYNQEKIKNFSQKVVNEQMRKIMEAK